MSSSQSPLPAQHNKHKARTSMPSTGFEPAIQADKRPQTAALDRTDNGIGLILIRRRLKLMSLLFQNWVRTSQKTRCTTIIRKNIVPTLRKLIAIYWGHIEKYVNVILLLLLLFSPGAKPPMGVVFYSPLVGFSLLAYEVS